MSFKGNLLRPQIVAGETRSFWVRGTRDFSVEKNGQGNWLPSGERSLGTLLIGDPQDSWESPLAKGVRVKLWRLVGTPLPRPAVDALASWPRALPSSLPSPPNLRGVRARLRC